MKIDKIDKPQQASLSQASKQLLDYLGGDSLEHLQFYPWLTMLFMGLFLTANLVAQKIVPIGKMLFSAGAVVFPFMYLLSLIVTEVYGYAMSRRMIWGAFAGNLLVIALIYCSIKLPAAACWPHQAEYQSVLGRAPRILAASLISFLIGEFLSSYVFAKIKVRCQGRWIWLRTLCATVTGQLIDSYLFTTIAFIGAISFTELNLLSFGIWSAKIFCQLLCTPLIYKIVNALKRCEGVDVFDRNANFNPFHMRLK